jgi:hypothetical protein
VHHNILILAIAILTWWVQVRTGANVTRVFFEVAEQDMTGHVTIAEAEGLSFSPVQMTAENASYAVWTVSFEQDWLATKYVVAEVDGVLISAGDIPNFLSLLPCPGSVGLVQPYVPRWP